MTHIGNVLKLNKNNITVEIKKNETCDECINCKGCLKKTYQIISSNNLDAKVGDRVKVFSSDNTPLLYIFIVFLLPIFLIIAIYTIFYKISVIIFAIVLAISLIAWLIFSIVYAKKIKSNKKYSSYIIEILKNNSIPIIKD